MLALIQLLVETCTDDDADVDTQPCDTLRQRQKQ